jgi:hypothetical protein
MNCWEATAHVAAEAKRLLPDSWAVVIHDETYAEGMRHVWATIELPGMLGPPRPAANLSGNDVLGGVHIAGKTVLRAFGFGVAGDALEDVEGDALPDWARSKDTAKERPVTKGREPARPATGGAKKKESGTRDPADSSGAMDDLI